MSFQRTSYGIINQHIFYGVDKVVFVEGGNSYSYQEVLQGNFDEATDDIKFWRKIFEKHSKTPTHKLKFKSIGSKKNVIHIAKIIKNENPETVCACADRDFDDLISELIYHPNVIYTFGYSWENDVVSKNSTCMVVRILSADESFDCKNMNVLHKLCSKLKFYVYIDAYFSLINDSLFFPRGGYLKYLNIYKNDLPTIDFDSLSRDARCYTYSSSTIYSFASRKNVIVKNRLLGHFLFDLAYQCVAFYLKQFYYLKTVPKQIVKNILLNNFIDCIEDDVDDYYETIFQTN